MVPAAPRLPQQPGDAGGAEPSRGGGSLLQGRGRSYGLADKCPAPPSGGRGATPSPRTKPRRRSGAGEERAKEKLGRGRRGRGADCGSRGRRSPPPPPPSPPPLPGASLAALGGVPAGAARPAAAPQDRAPPRPPPRPCATGSCGSRGRRVGIAARSPGGGGARGGGARRRRLPPLLPPWARGRCGGGGEAGGPGSPPRAAGPGPRRPAGSREGRERAWRRRVSKGSLLLSHPAPAPAPRPPGIRAAHTPAPSCPWPSPPLPRPQSTPAPLSLGELPGLPRARALSAQTGAPGPPGAGPAGTGVGSREAAIRMRETGPGRGDSGSARPGALARGLSSARPVAVSHDPDMPVVGHPGQPHGPPPPRAAPGDSSGLGGGVACTCKIWSSLFASLLFFPRNPSVLYRCNELIGTHHV